MDGVVDYKKVIQLMITDGVLSQQVIAKYVPELAESEDERIRKWILAEIKATHDYDSPTSKIEVDNAIAWLEKQGKQKICGGEVNDEALQEQLQIWFEKGKTQGKDEVIYHPENFGLQKPADKVEPKFHEGEWVTIK